MALRLEGTLSMIIREGGMDRSKERKQGGEVGRGTNRLEMDMGGGQQDSEKENEVMSEHKIWI